MKKSTTEIVRSAFKQGMVVPGFNIPYLPMMKPVIDALRDTGAFGLVMVARPEWEKFEAKSIKAIRDEYEKRKDERFTRLHLDHIPVIDEDNRRVDYEAIIAEALELGYESVMVDGSRLPLEENIACSAKIAAMAHEAGVPVEAELGAVMGHEEGPLPPYEELFASGQGFTAPGEAARFVKESGVDWLSVAIGNIHGAISAAAKDKEKPRARLSVERLAEIKQVTDIPLVLHGGSGIKKECVLDGVRHGIAKINVGTAIRQPYERNRAAGAAAAEKAVYDAMLNVIENELEIVGSAEKLLN